MSLNGLDASAVKEAYDAAVSEPGGWFLLKYASRDEVDLLGQGTGGIIEMRTAISQYEDASPLYGLLKYRRRNVIIKYLPENCSRLIQARVTVHFTAVCEKFAPYNTTFSIATAKELKDTTLSAACSLHTASSSTSSTSSLRRRRLIEIAEEEEEQAAKRQSLTKDGDRPTTPVVLNSELASSPDASKFSNRAEPPTFVGADPPSPRSLSNADMLNYASYYGKPRVKVAPRPSVDSGRPRTSGSGNYRPVSSIPAGFKLMSKGSRRGRDGPGAVPEDANEDSEKRHDDGSGGDPNETAIDGSDVQDNADSNRPQTSSGRPVTSSGMSTKSAATPGTKRNGMTPEMARLKKAMKLREKKMNEQSSPSDADGDAAHDDAKDDLSEDVSAPDATLADSAVDVGSCAVDHASLNTQTTDSHPASPLAISSDIGHSTKASSLSESTDETMQVKDGAAEDEQAVPTIAEPNTDDAAAAANTNTQRLKRPSVEPIRTQLGHERSARSGSHISDDESLMEELHSATVEEAKHMTVSKSPITPMFQSDGPPKLRPDSSQKDEPHIIRTASNPVQGTFLAPGDSASNPTRSASSFMQKVSQAQAANAASKKPGNLGSSISQRIKALEKLSEGGRGAPAEGHGRLDRPQSTFFSVRKSGSIREGPKSPSLIDRTMSLTRENSQELAPESHKPVTRERSGSLANRLSVFEGGNLPVGRPESIQVKARILRDPAQSKSSDSRGDPSEFRPLNLKQSPLTVDLQKAAPSLAPAPTFTSKRESIQERRRSRDRRYSQSQDDGSMAGDEDGDATPNRRRSSLSIVRDFIKERRGSLKGGHFVSENPDGAMSTLSLPMGSKSPSRPPSVHTVSGLARRLSISSRRSSFSRDRESNSPSHMTDASASGDESRPSTSDMGHGKSGKSRTGRFMRRLSSSFSSGRKVATPAISPTVAEEEESGGVPELRGSMAPQQPSITSIMGDVNVQFPDNLLWKRRAMCLDSQGFLILSTVNGGASGLDRPAGAVKRYHLSEFRLPYIPEMEMQELPNSICLDFFDGPGLQIACSDRISQTSVLQTLQVAHQSHTSFGQ